MNNPQSGPIAYRDAGVDIDAGNSFVDAIKPLAAATKRPGSTPSLGGFAAAFDLAAAGYKDPIILATTDGVGTKLKIAIDTGRFDTIGIDLVAMCVNDLLAQGAEPLIFLDYFAVGRLNVADATPIVAGIAEGCRQANCALVGGETAEMPGLYKAGDFDLAGFSVGAAERGTLLPLFDKMGPGDALIGVGSSGAHSNGYSLIRKIVERTGLAWDAKAPFDASQTIADAMLAPTRIYVRSIVPLVRKGLIKGLAHITGGGLTENPPRMLPKHLTCKFDWAAWERPPLFKWLAEAGPVEEEEMRRTFNCGLGLVLCVAKADAEAVVSALKASGESAWIVGELAAA
jgi:phosphoribosylformylglycinamidine cyclo-ligase